MTNYIGKVVQEELDIIPKECRIKGEYLCYILRSVTAPWRTYSGSTNNFPHRLRQHNGELVGGAVMTKTTRPWRIAALIYNFSNRSSALRFEWFTKMKHNKTLWTFANRQGKTSIQKRAILMMAAELKLKPEEKHKLCYFLPDYFFRRCINEARLAGVPGTLEVTFKLTEHQTPSHELLPSTTENHNTLETL